MDAALQLAAQMESAFSANEHGLRALDQRDRIWEAMKAIDDLINHCVHVQMRTLFDR
jgi:hypothetical protein